MKIYSYDIPEENEILRKISEKVDRKEIKEKEIQDLVQEMKDFLKKQPDGVGLSAPQVGVNQRIFILDKRAFDNEVEEEDLVFINPEIIQASSKMITMEEGCFSVRWTYGDVTRPKKIKLKYLNQNGDEKIIEAKDFISVAIQHEIDHLDGILFIDKAKNIKKLSQEEIDEIIKKWKEEGYNIDEIWS